MSFSIRLIPHDVQGSNKTRLGEIRVGDFVERFAVHPFLRPIEHVAARWRNELRALVAGQDAIGLPTASNMAWILYRIDQKVFVHQMLMLPGQGPRMSRTKKVIRIPSYSPQTTGGRVSEWATTIEAVRAFLGTLGIDRAK
jgi:hypothetical protein